MKITKEQVAKAISLLNEVNKVNSKETEIFIIEGSDHMYSKLENAIAQAKGKEIYRLELGKNEPMLVDVATATTLKSEKGGSGKPEKSEKPDASWKMDELRTYAEEKKIVLDASDKSKEAVLAKIAAAEAPAQ